MTTFNPRAYPKFTATQKISRDPRPFPKKRDLKNLQGEVIRVTDKAVLFRSAELTALSVTSPCWIPRGAIDQGRAIELGDTELFVSQEFLDRKSGE